MPNSLFLNTKQVADLLNRSSGAVRNLVLRRAIPFRKVGGRLVFLREEVETWINQSPGMTLSEFEKENGDSRN